MTTTVLAYIPSPAQGVWQIGPVPLRAYALFIIAGIIAALLIGDRRWAARGGEPGVIYDVVLWAVPFGLIGGRLYHVITDWQKYFGEGGAGLVGALRIWDGGLGIWGAVALGGVGAWIACRRLGIPLPAFGDAIAPGIILAQAIGRLGNYFNQELYGRETTLPWGLEIYERRNAAGALDNLNGVSTGELVTIVHPTFLYELLWNLLVFAALIFIDRRWRIGHGRLFAMYVAGYCLGRFWIELMRADEAQLLAGIRVNSFTSTFVFIGAVVYIMAAPKGREAPETLRGTHDGEAAVEDVVKEVAVASGAGVVAAAKAADADERAEDRVEEVPVADQGGGAPPPGGASDEAEVEADASVDPDAELGAQLAHAAEAMQAELDRRAEELGSLESGDLAAAADKGAPQVADAADVEADAGPAPDGEPSSPLLQFPPFDAAADAELGAQLAHAAEAMTAESVGREETAPTEPEAGLGSVEGDEVAAAAGEASEVHEAAVEGEAEAGELAEEVAEESDAGDAEQLAAAAESVTGGEPEAGLGSVEGDEVAAAADEASEVHEAAVEGEAEAGELAEEVAEESDAGDAEESVTGGEPEAGLGSVEGDEVAAAADDASDAHDVAAAGKAEAGQLAEESGSASNRPSVGVPSQPGGRVRQWLRRRRNR
ncbi:prolipoprotein diacylglyceryl transferase [Mycolicibacterium sp. OfavD-34-C]|uniref:prolipoprotein diacylglyceryl transferase n=1 Tax=Mycolicibacterium sp. OfavD-34-C TaxID=2917746 RepID=UPI001EF5DE0C|nr:prolipoprotein diacylglyceryl transferase [Mycolicibacterium sp. OfavD-34-C]MCG7580270.1 prolipoprotein diacylglyceryl transferase [Mycolicibacterium sp. OfavD-34-C]